MISDGVFRRVRTIRDKDTDLYGHVNNVVWVKFVVELADAHSRDVGLSIDDYVRLGGVWIVRQHLIDYHAQVGKDERIVEETWVESFRGARSVRRCRFSSEADGTPLVTSSTHWAFVHPETQRPRRIFPEVMERFSVVGD